MRIQTYEKMNVLVLNLQNEHANQTIENVNESPPSFKFLVQKLPPILLDSQVTFQSKIEGVETPE